MGRHTFHACVFYLQVRLELKTRLGSLKRCVRDLDFALISARTTLVGQVQDVLFTPYVAHIHPHTTPQAHAPVVGSLHNNNFVSLAFGFKLLSFAILLNTCRVIRQTEGVSNYTGRCDSNQHPKSSCLVRKRYSMSFRLFTRQIKTSLRLGLINDSVTSTIGLA